MFKILCFAVFLAMSNFAQAQIHVAVDGVQRYFVSGEPVYQTLTVSNNHPTETLELGVKIEIYKNIAESTQVADLELVTNDFLLAPRKIVLKPSESRRVRLVYSKPFEESEKVYRLAFEPRSLSELENDSSATGVRVGTKVITTAGMLVLVSPKDIKFDLQHERDEEGITFTNTGNIAVDFRLTKNFCSPLLVEECRELPGRRIYPGKSWRYEIPGNVPVRWMVTVYNDHDRKFLEIPAVR